MLKRLIGKWASAVAGACADDHHHAHAGECCAECEVRETACPPRCAGQLEWKIERGATAYATLEVRNVGTAARTFKFSATALAGSEPGAAKLVVAPATATLQPRERTVVQVTLQGSTDLLACQSYHAELLIQGAWEQCVKLACHVGPDPFSAVKLEHGDSLTDRILELGQLKSSIAWSIQRGVVAKAAITVHNAGATAQTIELEATPLIGLDSAGSSLSLAPVSLALAAGMSGTALLELQNSAALRQHQDYRSEIVVRGFHEQRVELRCHVKHDAAAHCSVDQGDAPTRKRAHRWTDHFQCTEACAPVPQLK